MMSGDRELSLFAAISSVQSEEEDLSSFMFLNNNGNERDRYGRHHQLEMEVIASLQMILIYKTLFISSERK